MRQLRDRLAATGRRVVPRFPGVGEEWRAEFYQDYTGPIILRDEAGNREGLTGSYGFIPKRRMPRGQRLTTMNARAETVGQLRSY